MIYTFLYIPNIILKFNYARKCITEMKTLSQLLYQCIHIILYNRVYKFIHIIIAPHTIVKFNSAVKCVTYLKLYFQQIPQFESNVIEFFSVALCMTY